MCEVVARQEQIRSFASNRKDRAISCLRYFIKIIWFILTSCDFTLLSNGYHFDSI